MKNNLIVILAHKRKTVADVHEATGVSLDILTNIYYERRIENVDLQAIIKICDYLNITREELFGKKIQPGRNQHRQNTMFREFIRKFTTDEGMRKEETDD